MRRWLGLALAVLMVAGLGPGLPALDDEPLPSLAGRAAAEDGNCFVVDPETGDMTFNPEACTP